MLKVYHHPLSTYARRVRIALLEKNIEAELVVVDMPSRAHRQEPYLSLNPYGRVPTIMDDGFVLYESTAILEYLEAKFPMPALVPADIQQRVPAQLGIADDAREDRKRLRGLSVTQPVDGRRKRRRRCDRSGRRRQPKRRQCGQRGCITRGRRISDFGAERASVARPD